MFDLYSPARLSRQVLRAPDPSIGASHLALPAVRLIVRRTGFSPSLAAVIAGLAFDQGGQA